MKFIPIGDNGDVMTPEQAQKLYEICEKAKETVYGVQVRTPSSWRMSLDFSDEPVKKEEKKPTQIWHSIDEY